MKRLHAVLFCAALFILAIPETISATPGILVPREVYVGDTAEFTFDIGTIDFSLDESTPYTVPTADFPRSPDLSIQSIVIVRNGAGVTATVRFIPWSAGVLQIPPFAYGNVLVTPPPVRIGSIIEKTGRSELQNGRTPLLFPGTTWLLYGIIAAFLAALAFGIYVSVKIWRYFRKNPGKRLAERRVRIFLREMKVLERNVDHIDETEWYASFATSLRRYFGAFCHGDYESFLASTGSEIVDDLRERFMAITSESASDISAAPIRPLNACPENGMRLSDRAALFFTALDRVRFGDEVAPDSRISSIADIRGLIVDIEEASAASREREDGRAKR